MKNVLIPLAPGFEEIETITVVDILRRSGARVSTAGIVDGIIEGSRGVKILADESINNINSKIVSNLKGQDPTHQKQKSHQTLHSSHFAKQVIAQLVNQNAFQISQDQKGIN
mgnify:CR=1 FL=1